MKSLNIEDLKGLVKWLSNRVLGAQLQDVFTDGKIIALELRGLGKSFWLCLDLQMPAPRLTYFEQKPSLAKNPKPVATFLRAHALNLRLSEMKVIESKGRVVEFKFGSPATKFCDLEFILIPKMTNLLVRTRDKSIAWSKPRELPPSQENSVEWTSRDWELEAQSYFQEISETKKDASGAAKSQDRAIEKKQKALAALRAQLLDSTYLRWRELGELLKWSQEIPDSLKDLFDGSLSFAQNRELAFKKSKDLQHKKQGTQDRILVLEKEIAKLQHQESNPSPVIQSQASKLLQKSEARARKLQLEDGLEAALGTSAKDNLAILRKARAWDLWLHLRDYPSAHAIIFRNKGQVVSDSQLQRVAQWLIKQSIERKKNQMGAKYDVVLAECRHVRPVRGATGLVTYVESRTFTVASKPGPRS